MRPSIASLAVMLRFASFLGWELVTTLIKEPPSAIQGTSRSRATRKNSRSSLRRFEGRLCHGRSVPPGTRVGDPPTTAHVPADFQRSLRRFLAGRRRFLTARP
jgi:hypothetical protein